MNELSIYLPFLVPLILLQFILAVTAFVHVLRHPHYRFGNKILWCVVVLLIQFIGPLVYFIFGHAPDSDGGDDI